MDDQQRGRSAGKGRAYQPRHGGAPMGAGDGAAPQRVEGGQSFVSRYVAATSFAKGGQDARNGGAPPSVRVPSGNKSSAPASPATMGGKVSPSASSATMGGKVSPSASPATTGVRVSPSASPAPTGGKPPERVVARNPAHPPGQPPARAPTQSASKASPRGSGRNAPPPSNRGLKALVCVLAAAVLVLLGAYVVAPMLQKDGASPSKGDFFDPAARSGNLPGRTQEEIQAELDKIVEEGMFNISIASVVTVPAGSDQALARVENIAANRHHMTVSITLDGETAPIYESAGLAPGQYIEHVKLSRVLPAGEYQATALFTAYQQDDLSKVGQAAARITIVVSP